MLGVMRALRLDVASLQAALSAFVDVTGELAEAVSVPVDVG